MSTPTTDSFLTSPLITRITGYIAHIQGQDLFTNERLHSLKNHFLITIGFLVLLYCLIHIQILFFWLLKFIFRLIFKIISFIFWLPLKTVRFLIPKTIDYDILFPVFWLCSISSFYLSKYFHENVWQFFDQYLVRRYRIFHYDQTKREEIKRYVFVSTFIVLLFLQTVFILVPITLSIRTRHANEQTSSTPIVATTTTTTTTTMRTPTAKTAVKDVVETMSGNLYNRFIDAFRDENETEKNEKRQPLVSDEKLEDTFKTLKKSITKGIKDLKPTNEHQEERKSSRFHRWIVHYLKAPFQKWEKKIDQPINSNIEQKSLENESVEEKEETINSSLDTDDDDDDDDDSSESDDDDEPEEQTTLDKVKNLGQNIGNKISSSMNDNDGDSDEEEEEEEEEEDLATKVSSSNVTDDEESDDESDDDQEESITDKLKEQLAKPIEKVQNIAKTVGDQLQDKLSASSTGQDDEESDDEESDDDDKEEESTASKLKEQLAKPIEKVQTIAETVGDQIRDKLSSLNKQQEDDDDDGGESGYDSDNEEDKESSTLVQRIKNTLTESIEKDQITSSDDEEDEESISITEKIKQHLSKPIETVQNLSERLTSSFSNDEDDSKIESDTDEAENLSLIDLTKQTAEKFIQPIKEKVSSSADELKHQAENLVHSTEDLASNILEKSSKILPKTDQIQSKIKHQIVEPLEDKVTKFRKAVKSKSEQLKKKVVNKLKSLKKKKKPKTMTEKVKEKFRSLTSKLRKKSKKLDKKSKISFPNKLNGWIDEAWNIWHLARTKLGHIFISSTKHARHLPRYNTTSLYTAFTDTHCYDYTKKWNRYRLLKRKYTSFLDLYRRHSPFPVYLSVLRSNGPRCYRQYPDSSCGVIPKSSQRNFKAQLYRFVRFWAVIGVLVILLATIYKHFTTQKQTSGSSFRPRDDSDRSAARTQSNQTDSSKPTTSRPTSIHQQTTSQNDHTISSSPLNEQIATQLHLWLSREQNDGYRNLSETCRIAINNTLLKQLERLSVETLQFANAKIQNVSQNNPSNETSVDKIIINARLDIDHLILNIVHTFKEKHFSMEIQKLSGQLLVILSINPNQYSIEANLQQIRINPVNIIDPNNALLLDEKQSIIKLLEETIKRTNVRCSFRLSDNQENTNLTASVASYPDTTKSYSFANQLSTSSIQANSPRPRQVTPNRYQPSESLPTVLINDTEQRLYPEDLSQEIEPKRLLVRIVKAVKLHNVEQPYCILELNHPKQIHQTSIAKNGLNPFWDERFLFECDDKSNQIHLQIIDRKKTNKRTGDEYHDTIYADVSIPFSYVTSTVYKQDVQISPQYPESIIRIEFSTLSEEEALAANNGYDVESLTDSQTWTYNEREAAKIEHDYPQRYPQSSSHDFISTSYDSGSLPKHYGLSTSLYDDQRDYSSTLPRAIGGYSNTNAFSPSVPLSPRDGGNGKPQKSKSFMSSLKHLTLPRRKHRNKDKHDNSTSSQASSISQLNTSLQSPPTNPASHSLSSENFLGNVDDARPIRRSRSISQSFKNLFRSSSKKKGMAAKTDALGEFENVDQRNYLSTSTPTTKKLSFLQRRKSKQKAKQQTNLSTNSLSSYDYSSGSSVESVRDTPVRANVGHPVTMTKSLVR